MLLSRPGLLAFTLLSVSLVGASSALCGPPFHANYNFFGESVVVVHTSSDPQSQVDTTVFLHANAYPRPGTNAPPSVRPVLGVGLYVRKPATGEFLYFDGGSAENYELEVSPNLGRATLSAQVPTVNGRTLRVNLTWVATEPFTTINLPSRPGWRQGLFYMSHALFRQRPAIVSGTLYDGEIGMVLPGTHADAEARIGITQQGSVEIYRP